MVPYKQRYKKQWKKKKAKIDYKKDKEYRIAVNKCDLCDDRLLDCPDDIEIKIAQLDELNDSYEDEYDKVEPRLLLCGYCQKEYQIPAYPV